MARVGIVGTGWGARVQVPQLRAAGLVVAGIAGHDPEKTRAIAERNGVRAYPDWRALLDDPAIDLVTLAVPPDEHLELGLAALDAGKHVLAEKPTALDTAEAERLAAAARARPAQLALLDHELRFLPAWREARARRGEIGRLRYAEIRYASPARGDAGRPWTWWSDAARGGGIWGAVGSHFADALRYLTGAEIEAAQAYMATLVAERRDAAGAMRPVTADEFDAVTLRFAPAESICLGAAAALTIGVVAAVDEPSSIVLHGENGALRLRHDMLEWAAPAGKWQEQDCGGRAIPGTPGDSAGGCFGTGTYWLGRALAAALDHGDLEALAPAATFDDGLAQQRILDAARRSHANGGRWESV